MRRRVIGTASFTIPAQCQSRERTVRRQNDGIESGSIGGRVAWSTKRAGAGTRQVIRPLKCRATLRSPSSTGLRPVLVSTIRILAKSPKLFRSHCSNGRIWIYARPMRMFADKYDGRLIDTAPFIGLGEQFCTDAVGQQAHGEQRLGACPPALVPVRTILQVSGPSRGWLSVWGSFSCCETRRCAGLSSLPLRRPVWK
jgi:hypothetical protein